MHEVRLTYVGGEGPAHELLPLPVLGLSGVASVLEILQSGPKVLDIVLQLVHSPEGTEELLIRLLIRRGGKTCECFHRSISLLPSL